MTAMCATVDNQLDDLLRIKRQLVELSLKSLEAGHWNDRTRSLS